MKLLEFVQEVRYTPAEIQLRREASETSVCAVSENLRQPAMVALSSQDLRLAFSQIDRFFLGGRIGQLLERNRDRLTFRVSRRMTSSGGSMTTRTVGRVRSQTHYDIAIAGSLIHQTYANAAQATVCGITCGKMQSALMRVMEHEMLHLVEMILWKESSCSRQRFKSMAARIFGHTASSHQMLTAHQAAREKHGLQVGDQVLFEMSGSRYVGRINRIQKRATVLVKTDRGTRYSDGFRYAKYYVPLRLLRRA